MPYVGFHPDLDPGYERARKGGKKVRGRAIEVIPVESMYYRWSHWRDEHVAHGTEMWLGPEEDYLWDEEEPPTRVIKRGATTGKPLVVYYLTTWPTSPQPWPDTAPPPRM